MFLQVKSAGSKSRASSAPPVRRTVLGSSLPPKNTTCKYGVYFCVCVCFMSDMKLILYDAVC